MRGYGKFLSVLFLLSAVSAVNAQQGPGGGGPGGGQGGPGGGGPGGPDGGGPPDPEQMRQMIDERIQKAMGASDDEFAKLQPLIDKVEELEHQSDSGPMMHGHPHPDEDNADGNNQDNQDGPPQDEHHHQSAIQTAISKLKKVLADKASTDDQITTAMKVVEDAEKKVKDDLATARKELKTAVTLRQQATLVSMGILD